MKPLNAAERRRAFLNFLFLFIITITVVLITAFFSVQVPFKENEKLRKDMDIAENEKIFLQSFGMRMQVTTNLIDSLNRANNIFLVKRDINSNIEAMTNMINDTISVKGLCNKIVDNLISLRSANESLRNVSNNTAEMESKNERIKELENLLRICNDQIRQFNARSNSQSN